MKKITATALILVAFCVLGLNKINAQQITLEVEIFPNPTTLDSSYIANDGVTVVVPDYQTYAVGQMVTMTGEATLTGGYSGTFDVSFDVTPSAGATIAAADSSWGVHTDSTKLTRNTFRGSTPATASLNNITFSNFAGANIISASDIVSANFIQASVIDATNNNDRFTYEVAGTEYISPTKFANDIEVIDLLTFGPEPDLTALTDFNIKTRSTATAASDRWGVGSIKIEVVVDVSNLSMGLNESQLLSESLNLYPNPVIDVLRLNMFLKNIEILDITGKVVKRFNERLESLDVSDLPAGSFIIKGQSDGDVFVAKKFIK